MTTHGTFTFDAENDADCQRFDFTSDGNGQTTPNVISPAGTAADFCHDTNGGNSVDVGPDYGQGGDPDGYLYTECSSPGASGDEYTMTFDTILDASAEQWQFNFYWCQRGPAAGNNDSFCEVQINEDGGGWVTVATFGGVGEDSITTVWNSESVDLSESGVNVDANTQVRIRIESQSETTWHADFGIDTVEIVGTPLANYEISGVTKDKDGNIMGSCQTFLCRDNGDNTATFLEHVKSHPTTGAYSFQGNYGTADHFVIAWKENVPHVFDVTDRILQGTEV